MNEKIFVDFLWIPQELGGHTAGPFSGMRVQIRWQQFLEESFRNLRDVECQVLSYDADASRGKIACVLASMGGDVPTSWRKEGQLIELLNGFRVLAVGKLVSGEDA